MKDKEFREMDVLVYQLYAALKIHLCDRKESINFLEKHREQYDRLTLKIKIKESK